MTILLLLVPISIVLLGVAIGAFIWATRSGQFEDLDTPSLDILREDTMPIRGTPPGRDPTAVAPDAPDDDLTR
jgi:cbb3-type cytochrome oxidase maturation protein